MEKGHIREAITNLRERVGDFAARLVVIPDNAFAPYPDTEFPTQELDLSGIDDTQEMDLSGLRNDTTR